MKRTIIHVVTRFLRSSGFLLTLVLTAWSQETATKQTLTLQVAELNKIDLNTKALTLTIDKLSEGQSQPAPVISTATKLTWTSNGESRKITIASNNSSPKFLLKAEALNVSPGAGIAVGEVTLSDNANHDFVVQVSRSSGSCFVRFTAGASVQQGIGAETYILKYTITGG